MKPDLTTNPTPRGPLAAGGLAALLASTCCLGPLALLALGVSGAWISYLTVLEPVQPFFLAAAAVALFIAGRRIWRPAVACETEAVCARPGVRRLYQLAFVAASTLLAAALLFPWLAPLFY